MLRPKIKSMFPSIAPVMEAFTRSGNPALIAITSYYYFSGAFPKVTFSNDPIDSIMG